MSLQKLGYFKTYPQRIRNSLSWSANTRQAVYNHNNDVFLKPGMKIPFTHNYATLKHMHDLRVWTICYAPSSTGNLKRLQEIHRINAEMWHYIADAMWKRIIAGIALWFFVRKIAKNRYHNVGPKDSHDAYMRDVAAHM